MKFIMNPAIDHRLGLCCVAPFRVPVAIRLKTTTNKPRIFCRLLHFQ